MMSENGASEMLTANLLLYYLLNCHCPSIRCRIRKIPTFKIVEKTELAAD